MSADLDLVIDGETVYNLNVTYNLTRMLYEAGWHWPDGRVWSREYLDGRSAADIGEMALHVLRNLEAEPERFIPLNPPNGWGSYDSLVASWREFIDAIREWPTATLETCL